MCVRTVGGQRVQSPVQPQRVTGARSSPAPQAPAPQPPPVASPPPPAHLAAARDGAARQVIANELLNLRLYDCTVLQVTWRALARLALAHAPRRGLRCHWRRRRRCWCRLHARRLREFTRGGKWCGEWLCACTPWGHTRALRRKHQRLPPPQRRQQIAQAPSLNSRAARTHRLLRSAAAAGTATHAAAARLLLLQPRGSARAPHSKCTAARRGRVANCGHAGGELVQVARSPLSGQQGGGRAAATAVVLVRQKCRGSGAGRGMASRELC